MLEHQTQCLSMMNLVMLQEYIEKMLEFLEMSSAWYHIVIKADSTQATASERFKVYLNGEDISSHLLEQQLLHKMKILAFNQIQQIIMLVK
jgi:hypothetical protein